LYKLRGAKQLAAGLPADGCPARPGGGGVRGLAAIAGLGFAASAGMDAAPRDARFSVWRLTAA